MLHYNVTTTELLNRPSDSSTYLPSNTFVFQKSFVVDLPFRFSLYNENEHVFKIFTKSKMIHSIHTGKQLMFANYLLLLFFETNYQNRKIINLILKLRLFKVD